MVLNSSGTIPAAVTDSAPSLRRVQRVVDSLETREGAGFLVHRPFPTPALRTLDPFILLDEMGPVDLQPGEAKGAPDHPHRGFETVTYVLEGRMTHRDSQGNSGRLGPGDVQWMTAGAGVVHSEMPDSGLVRDGGRMHGFQLWVNLPRADKMMRPRYQEISSAKIPVARSPDGTVEAKVIAGQAMEVRAIIDTRVPIQYLHFTLKPGAHITQKVPAGHAAFAYVVGGTASFASHRGPVGRGQLALFGAEGDVVELSNPSSGDPLSLLFVSGLPLGEPVVQYGPFVMNTWDEVLQAFADFESGTMGNIPADVRRG